MIAIASFAGCKSQIAVTLCSTADQPVNFVVRFSRAEPKEASGVLSPGGRTTVKAEPRGDGDYSIELRRDSTVKQHARGYYTSDGGGGDAFTVKPDLDLDDGCNRNSAPRPK